MKGIALDIQNIDEFYTDVLKTVIHALYKSDLIGRRLVFDFMKEIVEYTHNAVDRTLDAIAGSPQATTSERFDFQGASFVIIVDSFLTNSGEPRIDFYMTVTKAEEFEKLLSKETAPINQSPPPLGDSNKNLGISRADFVQKYNVALTEQANAQEEKPMSYYERLILNNSNISRSRQIIYFNHGEKNIRLGCLEGGNYLRAIFYEQETINVPIEVRFSIMLALYKNAEAKDITSHLRGIFAFYRAQSLAHVDSIESEANGATNLTRTLEKISTKNLPFEGDNFFVKVRTIYDVVTQNITNKISVTITRDAALENFFNV
ncbi:MAG: hypothetical protein SR3Q1_02255 [Quinella sp. 3Q1]|nr:hypothetical protein [Quinella sp. 3Q1]